MNEENKGKIKSILEALLFVASRPLSLNELRDITSDVEVIPEHEIRSLLFEMGEEYAASGRSFKLEELSGGFQLRTHAQYAPWLSKLYQKGTEKLSQATLETLAIVAYRQPITKAEIEGVRGVDVTGTLKKCLELGLVDIIGKKEILGRPFLYGTTEAFLKYFGLRSLQELPRIEELREGGTGQKEFKLTPPQEAQAASAQAQSAPAEEGQP